MTVHLVCLHSVSRLKIHKGTPCYDIGPVQNTDTTSLSHRNLKSNISRAGKKIGLLLRDGCLNCPWAVELTSKQSPCQGTEPIHVVALRPVFPGHVGFKLCGLTN